jgi:hypothetical protein
MLGSIPFAIAVTNVFEYRPSLREKQVINMNQAEWSHNITSPRRFQLFSSYSVRILTVTLVIQTEAVCGSPQCLQENEATIKSFQILYQFINHPISRRYISHTRNLIIMAPPTNLTAEQWPLSLRHEPSSPDRALGSRFESHSRQGCLRLFCVCFVLCVGSGVATGWSPIQGVL